MMMMLMMMRMMMMRMMMMRMMMMSSFYRGDDMVGEGGKNGW